MVSLAQGRIIRIIRHLVWSQGVIRISTSRSPLEEESKACKTDETDDTPNDAYQERANVRLSLGMTGNRDWCAPPTIAPVLDLELPLEPPVELGAGIKDAPVPPGWLERETTGGAEGVASGPLPAAWARTTSNVPSYPVC